MNVSEDDTHEALPIPRNPVPLLLYLCISVQIIRGPLATMSTGRTDGPFTWQNGFYYIY